MKGRSTTDLLPIARQSRRFAGCDTLLWARRLGRRSMDQLTRSPVDPDRIHLSREADFQLGALTVRPSRREVAGLGESHLLQPRVMQVLVALARPSSNVVSQDELIRRCWSGLAVSDDAIGRCISQLRKLAGRWPEPPFAIVTIASVGYRLDVQSFAAQGDLPQPQPVAAAPASRRRWRLYSAITATLVVLAAAILWLAHSAGFGAPDAAKRVAVLPLEPLSPGPSRAILRRESPTKSTARSATARSRPCRARTPRRCARRPIPQPPHVWASAWC